MFVLTELLFYAPKPRAVLKMVGGIDGVVDRWRHVLLHKTGEGFARMIKLVVIFHQWTTWDELLAKYPAARRVLDEQQALAAKRLAALQLNRCPKKHPLFRSTFAKR